MLSHPCRMKAAESIPVGHSRSGPEGRQRHLTVLRISAARVYAASFITPSLVDLRAIIWANAITRSGKQSVPRSSGWSRGRTDPWAADPGTRQIAVWFLRRRGDCGGQEKPSGRLGILNLRNYARQNSHCVRCETQCLSAGTTCGFPVLYPQRQN